MVDVKKLRCALLTLVALVMLSVTAFADNYPATMADGDWVLIDGGMGVGYYADKIKVVNEVLYVVTFRPNSIMANFCTRPGELEQRAEVAFRMDKFMLRNGFCIWYELKQFLIKMPKHDRRLFKYYFFKLDEIYPSKLSALRDICRNQPRRFQSNAAIIAFLGKKIKTPICLFIGDRMKLKM